MIKPLATRSQMLSSKLVNNKPVICEVCDRHIGFLTGLPVIMNDKEQIIGYVHPGCCAK